MFWRFKSCVRCYGDLVADDSVWKCVQCGHYYYPKTAHPVAPVPEIYMTPYPRERTRKAQRTRYGGIAGRNINAVIRARETREKKWWTRNGEVVAYLDQGRTVREIATLTSQGQRQIRVVREKLADLRAGEPN